MATVPPIPDARAGSSDERAVPGAAVSTEPWSRGDSARHREAGLAQQAWRAYFEATMLLQSRLEQHLKQETGLTLSDYNLLLLLNEAPNRRLRMGQLATGMVFSPSRLTYQVKTLEGRGLVARQPCREDRRGSEAVLTDEGRAAFRKAAAVHARQIQHEFLGQLDTADTESVLRVFSRLGRTLEGREARGPATARRGVSRAAR